MGITGITLECELPNEQFEAGWGAIKMAAQEKERLLAQALLTLTVRTRVPFESVPLHGLILLAGPPGTGKTTLARGLADQVARRIKDKTVMFAQVDPHALASAALGRSQQAVTKLFEQTIPEIASGRIAIVLLDEVETLAASRHRLSLEANPIDVHRATDAVLSGLDSLTRFHQNVLVVATTNFREALDSAVLSRADLVADIGLPSAEARRDILIDVINTLSKIWPNLAKLEEHVDEFASISEGMDGRRLRKVFLSAAAVDLETAKDLNKLSREAVLRAFTSAQAIAG